MGYIDIPADAIRTQREKAGMSRPELAKALGVKTSTLENWESGEMKITDVYVKRIARQLNCSLAELSGEVITRAEFEELKAAIDRIEAKLAEHPARVSVHVDAQDLAEKMGLTDADGTPVAVGDEISRIDRNEPHRVREIAVNVAAQNGKATVCVRTTNDQTVTAVDMRLPGHVVTRKATA